MAVAAVEFRLARSDAQVQPPVLDASQQAVVDHRGGALLVLAGPGTGKTTTLVEAVVARVGSGELTPEQILVLTFSRKAATELRERIGARLAVTSSSVAAMTFHAFCYAVLREFSDPEAFAAPPRLMTAPERDAVMAELLAGQELSGWPASVRQAVRTRGFAAEIQSFMSRLAALGLDTDDLRAIAAERERADWARVADTIDEYHHVADLQNLSDYTDLVTRAVGLAADPELGQALRGRYRLVVVDEYQDTDPLQVELLAQLTADGSDLVVVGDHDQAIYGFRGADVGGVFDFPRRFGARVLALETTRRFGPRILAASRAVLAPMGTPAGAISADLLRRHRELESVATDPGQVEILRCVSALAEAEQIAGLLRLAHLHDGVPWSQMAVLVRTGSELTRLQRALLPAGVPVEVAGDEVPLSAEPAVRSLVLALEVADDIAHDRPLTTEAAHAVLTGPLGELDAGDLRRLGRALRRADPDSSSADLLARAVGEPTMLGLGPLDPATGRAVDLTRRLITVLHRAAAQIRGGEPTEQALWTLWSGTGWPRRLDAQWESADGRAAADRDLDAVVALFHHAARGEESSRSRSIANFIADLRAQQIPADQIVGAGARPGAVRLMTAHRSKGLQWRVVVVAGVQEGHWPDVGRHGSLLGWQTLVDGRRPSRREQLAEERRLFYVACTRATSRLVVTAVQTPTDDGDQPSRFVTELIDAGFGPGGEAAEVLHRPARPTSLRGVITELRRCAASDDPQLRDEAAAMLAEIARHELVSGRPADPARWWAVAEPTVCDVSIRPPDEPLGLSGSSVSDVTDCSLRWFLARAAHGSRAVSSAQGFGLVVHALAADVVRTAVVPDATELKRHVDEVWSRLSFDAAWIAERERAEAHAAIDRFVAWHRADPRTVLAAEHDFSVAMELPDGDDRVILRGQMDRVELDADGRVHVVDLKSARNPPEAAQVAVHPQLGVYQLAVEHGATHDLAPGAPPGGAELVQLRKDDSARTPGVPKVQPQDGPVDGEPFFAVELVSRTARVMRSEQFSATPDKHCQFCDFATLCPARSSVTIGGADR